MVTVLRRFDAAVQKRFDAVVHAIMRRTGVTKRTLRRNGWGFLTAMIIARDVLSLSAISIWTDAFLLFVYGGIMLLDDWRDEEAERAGDARSVADGASIFPKINGWSGLVFYVGMHAFFWESVDDSVAKRVVTFAYHCAWLFLGYLCGTSPRAPKKQEDSAPTLAQIASQI